MARKKETESNPREVLSERAPPSVSSKVSKGWYEMFATPQLQRNRLFVVTVGLILVCTIMGIALVRLVPLKTVVPVLVHEHAGGRVSVQQLQINGAFTPTSASIDYFAALWAKDLLSLSGSLTEKQLTHAYRLTRGNATDEFKQFISNNDPLGTLQEFPHRTKTVSVQSISPVKGNILVIRVDTHTLDVPNHYNNSENLIVTVTYQISPPNTAKEILKNPIGFYVTDFQIQKSN